MKELKVLIILHILTKKGIQRASLNSISVGHWRNFSSKLRTIANILTRRHQQLSRYHKNVITITLLKLQKTNSHNVVKVINQLFDPGWN